MDTVNQAAGVVPRKILVSQNWRTLLAYFIAYFCLTIIGLKLRVGEQSVALMWPSAGLYIIYLALSKRRDWYVIVPVTLVAELSADLIWNGGPDLPFTLIFPIIDMLEALAGALMLSWLVPQPWQRRQSIEVTAYIVLCALVTPLLGAFFAAQTLYISTGDIQVALAQFGSWWASDLTGILLVAPIIGGYILQISISAAVFTRDRLSALCIGVVVVGILFVLLGFRGDSVVSDPGLRFLLAACIAFITLVWFSVREGPFVVALAAFFFALVLSLCIATPGTPIGRIGSDDRFLLLASQFLMLTVSLSAFVVSLALFERRHLDRLMQRRRLWGLVLSELATRLAQTRPDELEREVDKSLADIGLHARADRCKLLHIDHKAGTVSETQRWLRDGVSDTHSLLQNIPLSDVAISLDSVSRGETIYITQSSLPAGSAHLERMQLTGTRASAYAPIRQNGVVTGGLTLNWVKREIVWSNELAIIVQTSAQVIGMAITRVQNQIDEDSYREKLRDLTAELERMDEQVRRETAIEIHDGAIQSLAVARMKLGKIRQKTGGSNSELEEVNDLVSAATTDLRGIMQRMFPTILYELGLRHALEAYVREAAAIAGFPVELSVDENVQLMPRPLAFLLYKTCRELVTNAIKHATASVISVKLWQTESAIKLEVADDGVGLDPSDIRRALARGEGLGLFALQERLARAGGEFTLDQNTKGARITITLPLEL